MNSGPKDLRRILLGIVILIAIAILILLFVQGEAWFGERIRPLVSLVSSFAFGVTLLVFTPLAFFKKTKPFAAVAFLSTSYLFGLSAWILGLIFTYELVGKVAVIIGLVLLGIGVVPIGLLGLLLYEAWSEFFGLLLLTAATFGARAISFYIARGVKNEPGKNNNFI